MRISLEKRMSANVEALYGASNLIQCSTESVGILNAEGGKRIDSAFEVELRFEN